MKIYNDLSIERFNVVVKDMFYNSSSLSSVNVEENLKLLGFDLCLDTFKWHLTFSVHSLTSSFRTRLG